MSTQDENTTREPGGPDQIDGFLDAIRDHYPDIETNAATFGALLKATTEAADRAGLQLITIAAPPKGEPIDTGETTPTGERVLSWPMIAAAINMDGESEDETPLPMLMIRAILLGDWESLDYAITHELDPAELLRAMIHKYGHLRADHPDVMDELGDDLIEAVNREIAQARAATGQAADPNYERGAAGISDMLDAMTGGTGTEIPDPELDQAADDYRAAAHGTDADDLAGIDPGTRAQIESLRAQAATHEAEGNSETAEALRAAAAGMADAARPPEASRKIGEIMGQAAESSEESSEEITRRIYRQAGPEKRVELDRMAAKGEDVDIDSLRQIIKAIPESLRPEFVRQARARAKKYGPEFEKQIESMLKELGL